MKLKGITVQQLGPLVVVFVVIAVILGFSGSLVVEMQENLCEYTYATFNNSPHATHPTPLPDPSTGSFTGCCSVINDSANASNVCETWTGTAGYNVTGQGVTGISTFGSFLPLIALIIIIIVIVGLLLRNLGTFSA